MKTNIFIILMALILSGCGVSQADHDKLISENETLRKEINELKHGAERIAAQVESAYANMDYAKAKSGIRLLQEKHPESPKNKDFKILLAKINEEEIRQKDAATAEATKRNAELAKQREQAAAAEKERLRLANLNNTGIWEIGRFVDKFGDKTKDKLITNKNRFIGTFSNTATENTRLGVEFIIASKSSVSIQLYEYNSSNPVKATSKTGYAISMRDKDGAEQIMNGFNYSDRVTIDFENIDAQNRFHATIMKGGLIKFSLRNKDRPSSSYQFSIPSSEGYENALRLLTEAGP